MTVSRDLDRPSAQAAKDRNSGILPCPAAQALQEKRLSRVLPPILVSDYTSCLKHYSRMEASSPEPLPRKPPLPMNGVGPRLLHRAG